MNYIEYRIFDVVYSDIISKKKNIEFRLLNEKSEKIKIGDKIKFKVLDNDNKYIIVEVIDKYIYDTIDDLWENKDSINNILDYNKEELIESFNDIFGKDNVSKSKIVGIKFRIEEFK